MPVLGKLGHVWASLSFLAVLALSGCDSKTNLENGLAPCETDGQCPSGYICGDDKTCHADSSTFTVGGTVTGLTGSGLVLQSNGGDDLTVSSDGSFTFSRPIPTGGSYQVTVAAQPANPSQVCDVSGGSGTIVDGNITSVRVECTTSTFTVGGTVTGLAGSGLVLQSNGGDDLAISSDGSFTFAEPVADGANFTVTISSQPTGPSQVCTVSNGSGTIATGDVTDIAVDCSTSLFAVGGTVTGLIGTGRID